MNDSILSLVIQVVFVQSDNKKILQIIWEGNSWCTKCLISGCAGSLTCKQHFHLAQQHEIVFHDEVITALFSYQHEWKVCSLPRSPTPSAREEVGSFSYWFNQKAVRLPVSFWDLMLTSFHFFSRSRWWLTLDNSIDSC